MTGGNDGFKCTRKGRLTRNMQNTSGQVKQSEQMGQEEMEEAGQEKRYKIKQEITN